MRRCFATSLLTGLVLVLAATPASADPAGPTNYRSTITAFEGGDTVTAEILGGDAFVELTVEDGTEVQVEGYDGEPYLRFLADGTVERNAASPARWLNDARYGGLEVVVPPEASSDAPPRWETVATGGVYAWHDHRVHWMSLGLPPQVDGDVDEVQPVTEWELPLTIDGRPAAVTGELVWLPSRAPVLPGVAVVAVVLAGSLLVVRRPDTAPLVGALGAVAAGIVGGASATGVPPGADTDVALLILPGVAVLLAAVGLAVRSREGVGPRVVGALAGLPVLVWSGLLLAALTAPIVPTALPDQLARVLVAVALGAGIVALVAAARAVLVPSDTPSLA